MSRARSLLVINYRSAALTIEAIHSARAASSEPLQVVVVDNSVDAMEAAALRDHADALIVSPTNRGYAGGINLGRPVCSGEVLIVANPDVVFGSSSIDLLAERLSGNVAVSGPALFWDDDHQWLLPPSELLTTAQKLDEVLATRAESWRRERDRRRTRARIAFWSRHEPTKVAALSGAALAIRMADFDEVRGFDERYRLYFEETDFLRAIAAHRKRIEYVPAAKCRHLYNQSAGQVAAEAAARYAESELRYLEKWSGPFAAHTLKRLERPMRADEAIPLEGPIKLDRDDVVIEASPLPGFGTAAGHFPSAREVDVPPDVWDAYRGEVLYLRVVERASGRVLATYARRKMRA